MQAARLIKGALIKTGPGGRRPQLGDCQALHIECTTTVDPGSFDFNVTLNLNNTIHTGLRDDDGLTIHTFVVKFTQGAAVTWAAFDGYVADATVSAPIDDRVQMDMSIARSGAITWLDAA